MSPVPSQLPSRSTLDQRVQLSMDWKRFEQFLQLRAALRSRRER